MALEDLTIYKDLGIGVMALAIIYNFAKWTSERAFKEVETANKCMMDTHAKLTSFMETAYKDNTRAISDLTSSFKDFARIRDDIAMIANNQKKLIDEQQDVIKAHRRMIDEEKEILQSIIKKYNNDK